jgi:hypothetical protein
LYVFNGAAVTILLAPQPFERIKVSYHQATHHDVQENFVLQRLSTPDGTRRKKNMSAN